MEPLIKGDQVEIIYNLGKSNEYYATRKVSYEVYPNEYIILFGPSGCGKSTLMYNILGALPNARGKLLINNEDPYTYTPERLVRFQQETVGIIYQAFYLIPSLSVMDNVSLPLIFAGMSPAKREERALSLLRRFGVEAQANKLPLNLSGGQQQRVAVARSIVNDPQILLADEPVGNLDSHSADQVMEMLDAINYKEKKTVILVTHDAKYLPYAHRIFYLKDGHLLRVVANPEKEQINKMEPGKTIITELEKLARMFPYSSPEELQVKSVVNYLTQDLSFEQLEVLENSIKKILAGMIDAATFNSILTTPLIHGGIGINASSARTMTKKLKELLDESMDVRRFRKWVEEAAHEVDDAEHETDIQKYIRRLRAYILDDYEGEISMAQLKRLEKAIEGRVSGLIKKEQFQENLRKPMTQDGVGLNWHTARSFTLHLEKLIAQATELIRT